MRQTFRSRALWIVVGTTTLAIVLLITLEPARNVTHTVLGWLRVTPLEIQDDDDSTTGYAPMASATPTPTLAELVEVVSVEPSTTISEATSADINDLPFEVVGIDPPTAFSSQATRSVTTFGTVNLQLDTAEFARLLAPGFPSRRLARRLGTDELNIAGGALVVSSWTAEGTDGDALTLYQIEAPLVTGLPPRELELLAQLMSQAFLPPIVSREIEVLDIPLVQMALGLDVDAAERPAEPTLTELPNGEPAVTWMRDRSQFILTGPLAREDLLRLAGTAEVER